VRAELPIASGNGIVGLCSVCVILPCARRVGAESFFDLSFLKESKEESAMIVPKTSFP
jgi:hypothetical protein